MKRKPSVLRRSFLHGNSAFALAADYSLAVFSFDFFGGYYACPHEFATNVTDELDFGDPVVALDDPNGQN